MKSTILLSTLLAISLSATAIDFKQAPADPKRVLPSDKGTILSYHDAIKNSIGSIVHIATTQRDVDKMMNKMHPYLEQFFGPQYTPKKAPKRHGLGSGVIVSADGFIITNNHVIEDSAEIIVNLPGHSKEYKAKLIGNDPKSDIAVIKIEAEGLKPAMLGSSSDLQVGDVVFAIGNPFGIGQSVTQGIISANHKNSVGINEYENFIQTDASINPGNSGGALVDSRGALIGINTAIITRSGGNNGIGFAIEIDMVKNIAQRLMEKGSIERGFLGVGIEDLTPELQNFYAAKDGALINEVYADTPAKKAGLKRGDLVVKVNDKSVNSAASLKNQIGLQSPEAEITLTYEREKKLHTTSVVLQKLSDAGLNGGSSLLDGLELAGLDDNARNLYQIPANIEGILISKVAEESEAAKQGLQQGDIIIQVEQHSPDTIESLEKILKEYEGSFKRIYINRGGRVFVVALK